MTWIARLSFERLLRAALDRAIENGVCDEVSRSAIQRALMDRMAAIGVLEGSEEGGVGSIPTPDAMVDSVHRIRGGSLFALAFAAPAVLEEGEIAERMQVAEVAVARLGTAFQIVDDLTDFEFDVARRSHNLLVSQIHHDGSSAERAAFSPLWNGEPVPEGIVEARFADSARAVLERAYSEARAAFETLSELGHWFDPELSVEVVHAIVGLEGVARMESLTSRGASAG